MIEVLVVREDGTWEIPVQSVEWKGAKYKAPRSVNISLLSTTRGLHQTLKMEEGNGIIFKWKGAELFRGVLFTQDENKSGMMTISAYDNLLYLTKNDGSYVFNNKKASEILTRLCADFQISMGHNADTEYVIPSLVFDGVTLYDIVMKALNITYKQTGIRYYLYSKAGELHLVKRSENVRKWVIEDGVNLIDYSFTSSIDNTATRVKLQAGEEQNPILATANNGELQKRLGILQYVENVTEKLNKAQLNQLASQMLIDKGKVKREFSLDALGISDVISGSAIHVIERELGMKKGYYVDEDTHQFEGSSHTMSLTLNETDELPEVS